MPCSLFTVLEKLMKPQAPDKIAQILISAAVKSQGNLKNILFAFKAFLKTHKEASVLVSKLNRNLMMEAYESFNYILLLKSLLIRRVDTIQPNVPSQISYRQWLQNIFKDCENLRSTESYLLLLKVLSDFVPIYKSTEYLKIAIEINISVPEEIHSAYTDYIVLLKTRIQDLKPQIKLEETIEKILSQFEITDKIPPVVMEISLLQKHKYLNEFLPALLVPRVIPEVHDVRERLIEALDRAGKIPTSILQKYRNECQLKPHKMQEYQD